MAEEIVIGKLIIDNSDLDRAMIESKKTVVDLETAHKSLKKETDNLSTANEEQLTTFVQNETALKKARAEYSANQKIVLEVVRAQTGLDSALKENIRTQDQAAANTKVLTEARRKIDTTTVEGAKAIQEINTKIDSNNKLISESSSSLEKQKINIGNYPNLMNAVGSSFGGATTQIIGFAQKGKEILGELSQTVENYKKAQEASTVATQAYQAAKQSETVATQAAIVAENERVAVGFRYAAGKATETEVEIANTAATTANAAATQAQAVATVASTTATNASSNALKLLKIALISTGIGAIVVAFGLLITYLTSTQEGMDKITAVTRPLSAIFQSLIGVAQKLGKGLFDAFSSPKQLLNDLLDFIKGQVVNRLNGLVKIFQAIKEGDFSNLKDSFVQAATGVEDLGGKIKRSAEETAKFFKDAAARGSEIDRLTKSIEKSEINLSKQTEENISKRKELDRIVKDTSANIKDRLKANEQQNQLAREQAKLESGILEMKIKRLVIEQELNDTSRKGNKELADLEAQREKIKQRVTEEELAGARVIATARKEERAKQAKDAKDAFDLANKEAKNKIDLLKLEASQSNLSAEQKIANAQKVFELENNLAKRTSSGSDLQKNLLENRQNLSSEILSIAEQQINSELEIQKKAFEENKKITKSELDAQIQSANDLAAAQILLLDKKLLTEKQYSDALVEINNGKNESILIANTSFEEGEKIRKETQLANELALEEVAFQLRLQNIEDRDATEQEIKAELLTAQYQRELELLNQSLENKAISEELFLQKKLLADKKYNSEVKKNDKILADQKRANNVSMAKDAIGALQGLFGESKALSIAMALVNTYEGITAGLKLGYPMAIPAVALAAATGFAAVKNIMKTNKGSSSSGDSSARAVTTSGSASFVNSAQTSTIATVTQPPVEQNTVVTPPVLILESLQEVQDQVAIKINSK